MPEPSRILGAQDHLQQALARGLPFAIVTGGDDSGKPMLMRRFLQDPLIDHFAHLAGATSDRHAFLERVLEQLGFEPFDSSSEELLKLLGVFARHEAAQGRRTVIALEEAQDFGPHVLATVQELVLEAPQEPSPITFVLTGKPSLNRVLDSSGMRTLNGLTQWRYSLDDATATEGVLRPALEITLQGELVDRRVLDQPRMMIGRHPKNDLSLENRYVSRHHALLVCREDAIYVVDLQSTNGTYVNSKEVERHALCDGDVIQIGHFRLRYCEPAGATRPERDDAPGAHEDTDVLGPREAALAS